MIITEIGSIHQYRTELPEWTNPGPRPWHYLAYQYTGTVFHQTDNGTKMTVSPGSLLLIHNQDGYYARACEHGVSIVVAFRGEKIPRSFCMDCTQNSQILPLFNQLLSRKQLQIPENRYFCMARLYDILASVERMRNTVYRSGESARKIQEIYHYILDHYADDTLSAEALCRQSGISGQYLRKLFKEKYGVTPYRLITQTRLKEAMRLLETSELSVSQIGAAVGIRDVYYFSKCFRRELHLSPREYRQRAGNRADESTLENTDLLHEENYHEL